MRDRNNFMDTFSSVADLPLEPLPKVPLLELANDKRILIENHKGLAGYGCNEIQVKVHYGRICVRGNKLLVANMTKHKLIITGCIDNITLIRGK